MCLLNSLESYPDKTLKAKIYGQGTWNSSRGPCFPLVPSGAGSFPQLWIFNMKRSPQVEDLACFRSGCSRRGSENGESHPGLQEYCLPLKALKKQTMFSQVSPSDDTGAQVERQTLDKSGNVSQGLFLAHSREVLGAFLE